MSTIERMTNTMPADMADVAAGRVKAFDAQRIVERGRKLLATCATATPSRTIRWLTRRLLSQ